jgi:hypothetical protein
MNQSLGFKLGVATMSLVALAIVAGSKLAPQIPVVTLLAYVSLWLVFILCILGAATWGWLQVMQWVLRKGGTDTQWFWFASEPKGLVHLRRAAEGENEVPTSSQ